MSVYVCMSVYVFLVLRRKRQSTYNNLFWFIYKIYNFMVIPKKDI